MLIGFTVANYRSFRDPATLSMVAANLRAKDEQLDWNNKFEVGSQPALLTSAAIYGRNASGKSNAVQALLFMRAFVLDSFRSTEEVGSIDVEPFRLNTVSAEMPSSFEIVFVNGSIRYRYGFKATRQRVMAEWLYSAPKHAESMLFRREEDTIVVGRTFKEGRERADLVRPNALFLTVLAQLNAATAQKVLSWFRRLTITSGVADMGMRAYTQSLLLQGKNVAPITELVMAMDTGIEGLRVERGKVTKLPKVPPILPDEVRAAIATIMQHPDNEHISVHAMHTVCDEVGNAVAHTEFDLDEQESEGTQKLFALAGPLANALLEGRVLVIDEFDARLHPLLSRRIVELFNDAVTNPQHAQLVIVTHDTGLLDNRLLRRDQIWFVEKDGKGASTLYSLAEFKGVRNDKDYERGYLEGRYGAIPYVSSIAEALTAYEANDVAPE